jgi:RNA ligase
MKMKYDVNILNDYIERGLLEKNSHPTLPIDIYNYSRECQFSQAWDGITLNMRGTVLDREGNVVARAFPKFFNMEEHKSEDIPNEEFEVFEKMDGSLGILFHYADEWHLVTKGSFTSDQAKKGRELLNKYKYDRLLTGFTYLFEIIYKENRIVCSYDYEDLILLAVIDNKDGYEIKIHDNRIHLEGIRIANLFENLGFKIVKKYDAVNDYKQLKSIIDDNAEGFVIKFKSGFRMKIKGEEYVRLHRLLTNFSNVDIWELLKDKKDLAGFLDRVPDEFDLWVNGVIDELRMKYAVIEKDAYELYDGFFDIRPGFSKDIGKKEFALWAREQPKHLQRILFPIYDEKDYSETIWKTIRPKYQKPFWSKKED